MESCHKFTDPTSRSTLDCETTRLRTEFVTVFIDEVSLCITLVIVYYVYLVFFCNFERLQKGL